QRLERAAGRPSTSAMQFGELSALSQKDQQKVYVGLGTVGRIRHYYRRAHYTMHGCDYSPMKRDFKRAIGGLKSLHKSKLGFSKADCRAYVRAIEGRLDQGKERWEELACQEHILVLRDLAEDYARTHNGEPPPNLDELHVWLEHRVRHEAADPRTLARDLDLLPVLFRCSSDEVPAYRSSYVYRREAFPGALVLSAFCHEGMAFHTVGDPGGYGVRSEAFGPSQVDSLEAAADRCVADEKVGRAIQLLEGVANQRRDGSSFARLGHLHLAEGEFDIAEMVFEKALSEGKKEHIAEAFYGLGLVNMDLPGGGVSKIGLGVAADYFSEALARKPGHKEARFRRARARFLMGWAHECREELEEFLQMYPDHADAVRLMGDCYGDLAEEYGKAIVWYTRYLQLDPGNEDAERRLGRAYSRLKDYDDLLTSLESFIEKHPQATEMVPLVAQTCIEKGKRGFASRLLEQYPSAQKIGTSTIQE
ncbi:MAG: tetratricopeptide repeat protein, partial [Candidatus Latescibacteria bacterium]|nr:tetratricopeptide repeat protein [Candidatus Latescibacterota bacterium]